MKSEKQDYIIQDKWTALESDVESNVIRLLADNTQQ